MDNYLVEYTVDGDDYREVTFLTSQYKLERWLKDNIRDEYYAGYSFIIKGIYRYDGDGCLTILDLKCGARRDAGDDYIYLDYLVTELESDKPLFDFTVRIDGLA